ncbi:MAG: hypothetical protein IPN89_11950 [Saprospiraceae bacterium]|nr:hypothetical protein [Saprospiraceae bacterium]
MRASLAFPSLPFDPYHHFSPGIRSALVSSKIYVHFLDHMYWSATFPLILALLPEP